MPTPETSITVERALAESGSLHNSCRAVWVCKRCGNCARHCKHDDPANFHEDLSLPCSGPCQCIDCVPIDEPVNRELFRIRPLEWKWVEQTFAAVPYTVRAWNTSNKLFSASVWEVALSDGSLQPWQVRTSADSLAKPCASPEEGKQLAEQHWQEYVKQAPVETEQ